MIYRRGGAEASGGGDASGGRSADYVVASRAGRAVIALEAGDGGASDRRVRYRVESADPFGYGPLPEGMTKVEVAASTAASDYPDAPWQVCEFFRSPRAGDLIVCARPGYDLRARFEYQPHNGSHGGLHREHMLVPAAVNGAWGAERMRSVDLFPSILQSLGKAIPRAIDGAPVAIADAT